MKSMIVAHNDQVYLRSRAVRHAMKFMGGKWVRYSRLMGVIPAPIADVGYRIVARFRRILPGKKSCGILPPDKQARFLP